MAKRKRLNVRAHLEHVQMIIEGYQKWGKCPAIDSEMVMLSLINRTIMRKHDETRARGNRKDIRIHG